MQRCPCCNARLRERVVCARCRADLSVLANVNQAAKLCLFEAIHYYLAKNLEQSITAINHSLVLKKTETALAFREFIATQQSEEILDLLAQKKLLQARQRLYSIRMLFPFSQQLQQIDVFSDYMLVKNPEVFQKL